MDDALLPTIIEPLQIEIGRAEGFRGLQRNALFGSCSRPETGMRGLYKALLQVFKPTSHYRGRSKSTLQMEIGMGGRGCWNGKKAAGWLPNRYCPPPSRGGLPLALTKPRIRLSDRWCVAAGSERRAAPPAPQRPRAHRLGGQSSRIWREPLSTEAKQKKTPVYPIQKKTPHSKILGRVPQPFEHIGVTHHHMTSARI